MQIAVAADRPRFKTHVPLIFSRQPESEVCFRKSVSLFFHSDLEVDAGILSFNIREPGTLFAGRTGGRSGRDLLCAFKQRSKVPFSGVVADQIQAGFLEGEARDLKPATPE